MGFLGGKQQYTTGGSTPQSAKKKPANVFSTVSPSFRPYFYARLSDSPSPSNCTWSTPLVMSTGAYTSF